MFELLLLCNAECRAWALEKGVPEWTQTRFCLAWTLTHLQEESLGSGRKGRKDVNLY